MSWSEIITTKLAEKYNFEGVDKQEIIDVVTKLLDAMKAQYPQQQEAKFQFKSLVWHILHALDNDYDSFEALKTKIYNLSYSQLNAIALPPEKIAGIFSGLGGEPKDLQQVELGVDLSSRIAFTTSLSGIQWPENDQVEIKGRIDTENKACQIAQVLSDNGYITSHENFTEGTVGRSDNWLNQIKQLVAPNWISDEHKPTVIQLFQQCCQMDYYVYDDAWNELREKIKDEENGRIFNSFYSKLFEKANKKQLVKALLDNGVIDDVDWMAGNQAVLDSEEPLEAINFSLANTESDEFNEKLKTLIAHAKEESKLNILCIGQLRYCYPNYIEQFNEIYDDLISQDKEKRQEAWNNLSSFQNAIFYLSSGEYYAKFYNFFNALNLNSFINAEGGLIDADAKGFFYAREIGADERAAIKKLVRDRLLKEINTVNFNYFKFCQWVLTPPTPPRDDYITEQERKHLTFVDTLFEAGAYDFKPFLPDIKWTDDSLTFCYKYVVQHATGMKELEDWDKLHMDEIISKVNSQPNDADKINILALLSSFHAYLINNDKEISFDALKNAYEALECFSGNNYPSKNQLAEIFKQNPTLMSFIKNNNELNFIQDESLKVFISALKCAEKLNTIDERSYNEAVEQLKSFDKFILEDQQNTYKPLMVQTAKNFICASYGTTVPILASYCDSALNNWLQNLKEDDVGNMSQPLVKQLAKNKLEEEFKNYPQQEIDAREALKSIQQQIFQEGLNNPNPYELRGLAGVTRTLHDNEGIPKKIRITQTMDDMLVIIDKARKGKITARHAHAKVMGLAKKACEKHHIEGEQEANDGVTLKNNFYYKVGRGDFLKSDALRKTEAVCQIYCKALKRQLESTGWAVAITVGTNVNGNRLSPTMVKMHQVIVCAEKGKTSWEEAYRTIYDQAQQAEKRHASRAGFTNINVFNRDKQQPKILYQQITKCFLFGPAENSVTKKINGIIESIETGVKENKWFENDSRVKKQLGTHFGGKTIIIDDTVYKHQPAHIAQVKCLSEALKDKKVTPLDALDRLCAILLQASDKKTMLRAHNTHKFYKTQTKELFSCEQQPQHAELNQGAVS